MLKVKALKFHYWAPSSEFGKLPEDQRWMPDDLVLMLSHEPHLREAISALRKDTLLYAIKQVVDPYHYTLWYNTGHSYVWLLINMKESLKYALFVLSLQISENLSVCLRWHLREILYDKANVLEEKSLRIWSWRQYHGLAAHAGRSVQVLTTFSPISESLAHLALPLLQVLDYAHLGSTDTDHFDFMDHITVSRYATDSSLELSLHIWRLIRSLNCACRKNSSNRCRRCISTCKNAEESLKKFCRQLKRPETPRSTATALALFTARKLGFQSYWKTKHWDNSFSRRSYWEGWKGDLSKCKALMERYVLNMGSYLAIRLQSELNLFDSCYWSSGWRYPQTTKTQITKIAGEVALEFKELCSFSEEYRRSAWYWTTGLLQLGNWQQALNILEPLVSDSISEPSASWSHECSIIRLSDIWTEHGQHEVARRRLLEVQKAYSVAGMKLRSIDKNPLLENETLQVCD